MCLCCSSTNSFCNNNDRKGACFIASTVGFTLEAIIKCKLSLCHNSLLVLYNAWGASINGIKPNNWPRVYSIKKNTVWQMLEWQTDLVLDNYSFVIIIAILAEFLRSVSLRWESKFIQNTSAHNDRILKQSFRHRQNTITNWPNRISSQTLDIFLHKFHCHQLNFNCSIAL